MTTESLPLASLWSRFWAMVIDALILIVPGWFIHFHIPLFGPFVLSFLYYPFFYASALRATPGKKALGIQVVSASEGTALTLPMAALRHLIALGSSCALFIGHFAALFTKRRQALHDLVADSLVIQGTNDRLSAWNAWSDTVRETINQAPGATRPKDNLAELERLHDLRQKGAITEEEYQRLKARLIE